MSITEIVRLNIIRIRKDKGLSQAELARKAEMFRSQLHMYESGKAVPGILTLYRIGVALDVPIGEFFI
jgi:transcriptional regulator with XRE-family HTH domain